MPSFRLSDSSVDPTPCPTCGMPPINPTPDQHELAALRLERDAAQARVKELEAEEEAILAVLPEDWGAVEYIKHLETLAQERGAQVLALRGSAQAFMDATDHQLDCTGLDAEECSCGYRQAFNALDRALTSTADAAARVRREILDGAVKRVHADGSWITYHKGPCGEGGSDIHFDKLDAAILGEDAP